MRIHLTFAAAGLILLCAGPGSFAAEAISADPGGIVFTRGGETGHRLTAEELAQLPSIRLQISYMSEHGARESVFEGPLLWTVLGRAGLIDMSKPKGEVRQSLLVTGRDGYTALLAIGEISPYFEGKQVILAERMDDQPLGPEHLRIVVPGDKRGGRGVHDVVSIAVSSAQ